jgi:predicted transcriptional regulator
VAARIGQAMALLFGVVGVFVNPFLVVIALFVWMGAKGEASLGQMKTALSGMRVSQAIVTDFRVLAPRDTLKQAVELTLAGFQQDFPVMDDGRLKGLLTHANLLKGLAESGTETPVEAAMQGHYATAHPSEMLEVALARLQNEDCRALIVVREGRVVGLLTPENIGEMLTMEKALRASLASR